MILWSLYDEHEERGRQIGTFSGFPPAVGEEIVLIAYGEDRVYRAIRRSCTCLNASDSRDGPTGPPRSVIIVWGDRVK